jgi:hypothetical protein
MGVAVKSSAAMGRWREAVGAMADTPSIDPSAGSMDDASFVHCPEIDCLRALLSADVIEVAELRATSLGVERALVEDVEIAGERHASHSCVVTVGIQVQMK